LKNAWFSRPKIKKLTTFLPYFFYKNPSFNRFRSECDFLTVTPKAIIKTGFDSIEFSNIFAPLFSNGMISVDAVTVEFNGSALFSNITFNINENDRIALMGKNGAGKSTLLKIIAGYAKPTRGKVSAPKEAVIAYLPQHLLTEDNATVFEETSKAFSKILDMKKAIDELNHQLETRTDYESDEYAKIIEQVSELSEKYYSIEEINFDAEVEKTLKGLGFDRSDFNRPTVEFSGGWRMRIELAKILLQKPDLILLDEPTNHLDIESIQWLEEFLVNNAKAVIVISHDKAFVDNITNRTIEVTMGRIYDYKVPYTQYLQLRKERREQQQKQFDDQAKQIADIQEFIERFKGTYSKTLQVQSRVKMLEKIEIVQVDEVDTSQLNLKFPPAPRSGNYPVIIDSMTKRYGDHVVFKDATLTIARGEKIALVGKNGEGKSTLVKAIMGEIDFEGRLQLGHNSMIGYFAQNQASRLDESMTVYETIDAIAEGDIRSKIKDILGAFMFSGDTIDKKVKYLSGGEKTRLAMIKLLLQPVNLLILDEPTNHLDIKTKDILKDALRAFDGTLILVSHDRDFLDGLATKVFEFGNKRIKEHFEDINGFLRNKKMENLKEIERTTK
jgi:ATP-binding cassette, subfamily F, member 3